jgi:YVTN family beta-propeller protein
MKIFAVGLATETNTLAAFPACLQGYVFKAVSLFHVRLAASALALLVVSCVPPLALEAGSGEARAALPARQIPSQGRKVTPAGKLVRLIGDMPLKIVPAPDGKYMLIVTAGYHDHAVDVIDVESGRIRQHVVLGQASAGVAVDGSGSEVYVAGGGPKSKDLQRQPEWPELSSAVVAQLGKPLLRLKWNQDGLALDTPLPLEGAGPTGHFIAGLAAAEGRRLFVCDLQANALYEVDAASGHVVASVVLGYRPYQVALSPDGRTLAAVNWGDKSASLVDVASFRETARIAVGTHPTDLTFAPDGRLFVANASSNSVSVISAEHLTETIVTSLRPDDLPGSTPNALAVSTDGTRLYVANADNNDVAVVDIHQPGRSRVLGFIPTGWYPTALGLTPDGRRLVVGVAKGIGSRANWPGLLGSRMTPDYSAQGQRFDYVGNVMTGYAEIISIPDAEQLSRYTRQVRADAPAGDERSAAAYERDARSAFHHIKHVVYIIRENRTYDQVLGDEPRGDGNQNLACFGRTITPNAHALVERMALLDRYFVNGDVSADGHNWADSAYANAYVERTTASAYGGRGEPADGDQRVYESPAGQLWNVVNHAGLSFYIYGEHAHFNSSPNPPFYVMDKPLEGHVSLEWGDVFDKDDVSRAGIVLRDLESAERSGKWPSFTVIWLPWDHTLGLSPGKPAPLAAVASNDLALGLIVQGFSHSRFWESTAIFVTEDDAQDGPDHVDDHRSVGLVISPYVKTGLVDHTPYTMTSMIRTMEMILRVPPMTQYDRDATPMYRLFHPVPHLEAFTALPETVDLGALNPPGGPLAEASLRLDFSNVDRADPQALNAILWQALNPGQPMPAPVHSAFFGTDGRDDD